MKISFVDYGKPYENNIAREWRELAYSDDFGRSPEMARKDLALATNVQESGLYLGREFVQKHLISAAGSPASEQRYVFTVVQARTEEEKVGKGRPFFQQRYLVVGREDLLREFKDGAHTVFLSLHQTALEKQDTLKTYDQEAHGSIPAPTYEPAALANLKQNLTDEKILHLAECFLQAAKKKQEQIRLIGGFADNNRRLQVVDALQRLVYHKVGFICFALHAVTIPSPSVLTLLFVENEEKDRAIPEPPGKCMRIKWDELNWERSTDSNFQLLYDICKDEKHRVEDINSVLFEIHDMKELKPAVELWEEIRERDFAWFKQQSKEIQKKFLEIIEHPWDFLIDNKSKMSLWEWFSYVLMLPPAESGQNQGELAQKILKANLDGFQPPDDKVSLDEDAKILLKRCFESAEKNSPQHRDNLKIFLKNLPSQVTGRRLNPEETRTIISAYTKKVGYDAFMAEFFDVMLRGSELLFRAEPFFLYCCFFYFVLQHDAKKVWEWYGNHTNLINDMAKENNLFGLNSFFNPKDRGERWLGLLKGEVTKYLVLDDKESADFDTALKKFEPEFPQHSDEEFSNTGDKTNTGQSETRDTNDKKKPDDAPLCACIKKIQACFRRMANASPVKRSTHHAQPDAEQASSETVDIQRQGQDERENLQHQLDEVKRRLEQSQSQSLSLQEVREAQQEDPDFSKNKLIDLLKQTKDWDDASINYLIRNKEKNGLMCWFWMLVGAIVTALLFLVLIIYTQVQPGSFQKPPLFSTPVGSPTVLAAPASSVTPVPTPAESLVPEPTSTAAPSPTASRPPSPVLGAVENGPLPAGALVFFVQEPSATPGNFAFQVLQPSEIDTIIIKNIPFNSCLKLNPNPSFTLRKTREGLSIAITYICKENEYKIARGYLDSSNYQYSSEKEIPSTSWAGDIKGLFSNQPTIEIRFPFPLSDGKIWFLAKQPGSASFNQLAISNGNSFLYSFLFPIDADNKVNVVPKGIEIVAPSEDTAEIINYMILSDEKDKGVKLLLLLAKGDANYWVAARFDLSNNTLSLPGSAPSTISGIKLFSYHQEQKKIVFLYEKDGSKFLQTCDFDADSPDKIQIKCDIQPPLRLDNFGEVYALSWSPNGRTVGLSATELDGECKDAPCFFVVELGQEYKAVRVENTQGIHQFNWIDPTSVVR